MSPAMRAAIERRWPGAISIAVAFRVDDQMLNHAARANVVGELGQLRVVHLRT
jgi:hypothetical protein